MLHRGLWIIATCGCILAAVGCSGPVEKANDASAESIEAQKAVAGVGKQGQGLKDVNGVARIIAGPLQAMVNVKQKSVLEFQIVPAVKMFKASEGRFPKSHQEFMEKIVEANKLQLPELPEGAVYHFNSEKGELWVYPADEVPAD